MNNDAEETCHTLAEIGRNIGGQQAIFSHLSSGARRIAYPFSFAGSSPGGIRVCAALLFVEVDSGLPVMIRRLPGPGADMIAEAVSELAVPDEEPEEVILFINPEESTQMSCQGTTGGEPDLTPCLERGVPCISLLPHESSRYDTPVYLTEFFTRDERLILTGSAESGGIITYLFKDVRTATQETDELLSALQKNVIDRATLRRQLKRAGRRLIQSSIRTEPEEIYDLAALEDRILTSVTMIRGHFEQDLIDGNAISGSLFISLLSASLLWKMKIKDRQDR